MNSLITELKPGSPEAARHGCLCPQDDNRHGEGAYSLDGVAQYFINEECPLHGAGRTYEISPVG